MTINNEFDEAPVSDENQLGQGRPGLLEAFNEALFCMGVKKNGTID